MRAPRQSAIVGYLIAGMLLGPNALQWISNSTEVELLAEFTASSGTLERMSFTMKKLM